MMHRSLLFAAIAIGSFSQPAMGQVSQQEAARIQRDLTEAVEAFLADRAGDEPAVLSAPISVVPEDGHYVLTVPPLDRLDRDATLGGLTGIITPTARGWLDGSVTLANPFWVERFLDNEIALTIGTQSITWTYAPELLTLTALDAAVRDLRLSTDRPEYGGGGIDAIVARESGTEVAPGVYDVIADAAIEGARIDLKEGGGGLRRFGFTASATALDAAGYAALERAVAAFDAEHGLAEDELPDALVTPFIKLYADLPVLFDDFRSALTVEALAFDRPGEHFALESASLRNEMTGLASGAASYGLHFDLAGLEIAPLPAGGVLIPSDASLDITLSGLPNADIAAAMTNFVETVDAPTMAAALTMAGQALAPALLTSGTLVLEIAAEATTSAGSLDLEASLRPNPLSPFLAVGTATMAIGGVDETIAALSADPQRNAQAVQVLTMLKLLGASAVDAAGRPVLRYDVVLGPHGELTLNGRDLRPLLGGV